MVYKYEETFKNSFLFCYFMRIKQSRYYNTCLKKSWSSLALIILLVGSLFATGCSTTPTGEVVKSFDVSELNVSEITDAFPLEVAMLNSIDLSYITTIDDYYSFAEDYNKLILIVNEELDLTMNLLDLSSEGFANMLNLISKYSPLIDNYNQVVSNAVEFRKNELIEYKQAFYKAVLVFAFEAGLIAYAVFYGPAYNMTGAIYRQIGLNRFAIRHPKLISVILSNMHWTIRASLTEGSSLLAKGILDYANDDLVLPNFQSKLDESRFWFDESYPNLSDNLTEFMASTHDFVDEQTPVVKDYAINATTTVINETNNFLKKGKSLIFN